MHAPLHDAGISLRNTLPQGRVFGGNHTDSLRDIQVQSLCSDSRRVRQGDLFVALAGPHADGHDHVAQAIQRGAAAVLTERLLPLPIPQYVVNDTRLAHSELCLEMAGRPERQLRVTGVVGTAGKTVTSLLMASVLRAAGRRVGLTSSIGYCDSEDLAPARETTPRAPEFATWLSRMAENQCDDAVVELDSIALTDRRADAIPLDAAVITNLRCPSPELQHLHPSYEAYQRLNRRLMERLHPESVAVVNADDPVSMALAANLPCGYLTFGLHSEADVSARVLERNRGEQTFLLSAGSESIVVRTRMLGDFHVQNCLSAAAIGLTMELSLTEIVSGLEALDRVPGRLDRVVAGQPHGVFLDASLQCATLANNLEALRDVTPGKLICVFGASAIEDDAVCAARGRVVERMADRGIVTGHRPDTKASLQSLHTILDGYDRPGKGHLMPNRHAAIQWALEEAKADDTVLIAGAAASERQFVEQLLTAENDRRDHSDPPTLAQESGLSFGTSVQGGAFIDGAFHDGSFDDGSFDDGSSDDGPDPEIYRIDDYR